MALWSVGCHAVLPLNPPARQDSRAGDGPADGPADSTLVDSTDDGPDLAHDLGPDLVHDLTPPDLFNDDATSCQKNCVINCTSGKKSCVTPSNVKLTAFGAPCGPLTIPKGEKWTLCGGCKVVSGVDCAAGTPVCQGKIVNQKLAISGSYPAACLIYLEQLTVEQGATLYVQGNNAAIIVAWGDVAIHGVVDASASGTSPGPGGGGGGVPASGTGANGSSPYPKGQGNACTCFDSTKTETDDCGGGGGGYATGGGRGGHENGGFCDSSAGAFGGKMYTVNPTLQPLVGGAGGGSGDVGYKPTGYGGQEVPGSGGGGGGGIQISAHHLQLTGAVLVGGAGGGGGNSPNNVAAGGGGGGAGGAILLEAETLSGGSSAWLIATGGGGGGGSVSGQASDGNQASQLFPIAAGGASAGTGAGPGGMASYGSPPKGAQIGTDATEAPGGGGGGAGFIRIQTTGTPITQACSLMGIQLGVSGQCSWGPVQQTPLPAPVP